MSDLILIEQFRQYLVDQGVVRAYGDTANGLPQCILQPRDGAPEPTASKDYEGAVVTITKVGQTPPLVLEEFLEEQIIQVVARAYRAVDVELIQRRIRATVNGNRLFLMGAMLVEWSRVYTGDQPLGSDETDYVRMQMFAFRVRTLALAGVPYWE